MAKTKTKKNKENKMMKGINAISPVTLGENMINKFFARVTKSKK